MRTVAESKQELNDFLHIKHLALYTKGFFANNILYSISVQEIDTNGASLNI